LRSPTRTGIHENAEPSTNTRETEHGPTDDTQRSPSAINVDAPLSRDGRDTGSIREGIEAEDNDENAVTENPPQAQPQSAPSNEVKRRVKHAGKATVDGTKVSTPREKPKVKRKSNEGPAVTASARPTKKKKADRDQPEAGRPINAENTGNRSAFGRIRK